MGQVLVNDLREAQIGRGVVPAAIETAPPSRGSWAAMAAAWTAIGLPLARGIWKTVESALALFR